MDFSNAKKLLELCDSNGMSISEVMKQREYDEGTSSKEEIIKKMRRVLEIMRNSATTPVNTPMKSMGGLIGGEAKKLNDYSQEKKNIGGSVLSRGIMYAVAVLECNASMGLIVAAPTAGSSGVVPGLLLAMQDVYSFSDEKVIDALFASGAIGYLAMRNATVAGAVGGCQAEMGVASAMAAAGAVELMGGTPAQSLDAASTVLMNMLGLVCDPVGGLVEYPCQNRNASGVANALVATDMALAGITQLIPFDEMLETMYLVGKRMPVELRETALGGCAVAPSACNACGICG
jgi:L-serine dehydratase, iron-sulfur-dependent, alpha subunit